MYKMLSLQTLKLKYSLINILVKVDLPVPVSPINNTFKLSNSIKFLKMDNK